MVGTEEHKIIALAYLSVKIRQKVGYRLVETQISVFGLYGMRAHLMTYIVGARTANGEQISLVVGPKLFAFDGSLGKVERQRIAERRIPYYIITVLIVQCRQIKRQSSLNTILNTVFIIVIVGSTLYIS